MHTFRFTTFAAGALLLISGAALATPVNLGNAGDYALLAAGTRWNGQTIPGSMTLGSGARIHGNVGAMSQLELGAGANVYGNANYGSLTLDPGAGSITGTAAEQSAAFWAGLRGDLTSASQAAQSMAGAVDLGAITGNYTFASTGATSVFDLTSLNLGAGNSLTLSGHAGDQFIINVANAFNMANASIVLDGISASDVLFNVYGAYGQSSFTASGGSLQGTFLAPYASMTLGDGITANGARFLAAGMTANLQDVYGDFGNGGGGPVPVPEPAALPLLLLGVIGVLALAWRRRKTAADVESQEMQRVAQTI
ncbi:MAG TPA: choice-of-anchor A family protein [Rhodanobacteraceae bacterium]